MSFENEKVPFAISGHKLIIRFVANLAKYHRHGMHSKMCT